MDIYKIKKVGTREEVFKGLAERTAGSLKKDDIIEKCIGNHKIYISKKLSDRMKLNIATLRINNPNFFKRLQKKTMVNANSNDNSNINTNSNANNSNTNTTNTTNPNTNTNPNTINPNTTNPNTTNPNTTNPNTNPNPNITSTIIKSNVINKTNILQKNNKHKLHPKTQKLAFKVKDNACKTIYYPELQGINLKELKEELVREEAEEDFNNTSQNNKIKSEPFKIEDIPDIDMNDIELS